MSNLNKHFEPKNLSDKVALSFTKFFSNLKPYLKNKLAIFKLFTVAIAGLLFIISYHELALNNYSREILLGMIIAFVSSFFAAWTVILSHRLAHAGVSTTEILSQRFYALWLVSGLALCIFYVLIFICKLNDN